jgi:hypothetical protein
MASLRRLAGEILSLILRARSQMPCIRLSSLQRLSVSPQVIAKILNDGLEVYRASEKEHTKT